MTSEGNGTEDEVVSGEASLDTRHATKMAKKKVARDKIMATKSGEKGLIIVHTGAGKGLNKVVSPIVDGNIVELLGAGLRCRNHNKDD